MSRRTAQYVAATLLAALLVSALAPSGAAAGTPAAPRVIVLMTPYLTWTDLEGPAMPNARALSERSLLANMNVRAGAAGGSTAERGALVLAAGASVLFADGAMTAFDASETVGTASARDLYHRVFALDPKNAAVLYPGLAQQVTANQATELDNELGALGSAVHLAGYRTASIGNSDPGLYVDALSASRPAGVAAADASGVVDVGDVSTAMLKRDPLSPYGVRANVAAISAGFRRAIADPLVRLVVVDPGDLSRANAVASISSSGAAAATRDDALRATDDVLGALLDQIAPGDVVIVAGLATATVPEEPAPFGPLMIAGPDGGGVGAAASTHRDGIVTAMDLTRTIVDLFGGTPSPRMVGSLIVPAAAMAKASTADRIADLDRMAGTSVAVESVRGSTVNTFILLTMIALIVATLILYRGADGLPARAPAVAQAALLLVVCVLLAAIVQFAVVRWPSSASVVIWTLLGCTAVIWIAALLIGRGRPVAVPLMIVTGLTAVISLVDQWMGAPLSFAGLFGYSPLLGARYYGLGNEMSGLLLGSVLVAVALALDTWRETSWARHVRLWGWPLIGLLVLITTAAPFWGANVGAVAWMTVGFLVGWLILNGHKVWTWRNLVLAAALVVVILIGLTAVDLMGGPAAETHLGRAFSGVQTEGVSSFVTLVARKAETNARVLGRTNWTWLLVSVLLLLGYMRWRPRGEFAAMLKEYPAFSAAVAASLFAGVAGYFTEDSGIIIPALLLIPVGVSALYLMLGRPSLHGGDGS